MPIKDFVTGTVPFLESYTPFSVGNDVQVVDDIQDMISIDVKPRPEPTQIEYYMGSATSYTDMFQLKNLTQNVVIEATIKFNNKIFTIHEEGSFVDGVDMLTFNIQPEQTKTFIILTKNNSLNYESPYSQFTSNIEFTFKNMTNGTFVSKRINAQSLPDRFFPTTIKVQ